MSEYSIPGIFIATLMVIALVLGESGILKKNENFPQIQQTAAEIQQYQNQRTLYTAGSIPWISHASQAEQQSHFGNICTNTYGLEPDSQLFNQCVHQETRILELKARKQLLLSP